MNLRNKVLVGYFILVVLIGFMASILIHERHRISEIDSQNSEVQQAIRDIHNVHRYITRLTMLGESVIDWNRTDCSHYRIQRLCTDSLLQALKFHCAAYVYPAQIDTLRSLLASKEEHLRHIMSVFERQEEADSILVNHLPEVAKRATSLRTVQQKKRASQVSSAAKDRTSTSLSPRVARVWRQLDCPATETGDGDGCLHRQPSHT